LKAGEDFSVPGYIIRKKLKGDKATEFEILSLVHHAHASTTELLGDAVVRDGLTNHRQDNTVLVSNAT
jgi:hypothetical protein